MAWGSSAAGFFFWPAELCLVVVHGNHNGRTNRPLSWRFVQGRGVIKVDRLCSTAPAAHHSQQCYLREINTILFSGSSSQEHAENQYISQTRECLFLALAFVQELHCQSLPHCLMPSNTHRGSGWNCRMGGSQEVRIFPDAGMDSAVPGLVWDLLKQMCCNNFYSFLLGWIPSQ